MTLPAVPSAAETLDLANRRWAARELGLPLSSSWAEIHAERARRSLAPAPHAASAASSHPTAPALPAPLADAAIVDAVDAVPLERDVQRAVARCYRDAGCTVYWLSQARKSGQTPGLPDLYVVHRGVGAAWWHEAKRPGGERSAAQDAFLADCRATGTRHVTGGVAAAEQMLRRLGIPVPPRTEGPC